MSKFKKHNRFDVNKADKGHAHHVTDELGNYYGTFTLRFFDPHNKVLKVEWDRYEREHGNDKPAKGKLAGVYSFVNVILMGWEGVEGVDGKDVPFTRGDAFELLSDEDGNSWLFNELIRRSKDASFYAPSLTTEKEEVAGK